MGEYKPRKSDYRPCVGIVLFNKDGQVWSGRRAGAKGEHVWQFPQGGIDSGEPARFAGLRELYEETGIGIAHLEPLGKTKGWLYYDFPEHHKTGRAQHWRGQRQRWFAYRFKGKNSDFDLNIHTPEFSEFKWIDLPHAAERIVPFKRKVYEQLAIDFALFSNSAK